MYATMAPKPINVRGKGAVAGLHILAYQRGKNCALLGASMGNVQAGQFL